MLQFFIAAILSNKRVVLQKFLEIFKLICLEITNHAQPSRGNHLGVGHSIFCVSHDVCLGSESQTNVLGARDPEPLLAVVELFFAYV